MEQIRSFESAKSKDKLMRKLTMDAREAFQIDLMPSFATDKVAVFKDRHSYAIKVEDEDNESQK